MCLSSIFYHRRFFSNRNNDFLYLIYNPFIIHLTKGPSILCNTESNVVGTPHPEKV